MNAGLPARGTLALGDPATELIKTVQEEGVDLIATFLNDLLRGTTVERVCQEVAVPVLLLRVPRKSS